MAIGTKVGSLKNLKRSLKQGTAGPIRYIPKEGGITVRFLEEPENWVNFNEHYDATMRKSFPCIEDGCPGCKTDERKTSRYLANALDVERGQVIAIQLPKNLTNSLVRKYERYDTIMDRDYTLIREGEGLDTEYDAEAEPVMKRKITQYELKDLQVLLDQVYKAAFEDDDDDDDEDEKPRRGKKASAPTRKRSAAAARLQEEDEDEEDEEDDEEEDDEPAPARRKASRFRPASRDEDEDEDDEDEDEEEDEDDDELEEDEDDDEEDEDEDDWYTDEELKAMTLGALRLLAKENDIASAGLKKADLIEALSGG